ncbi:MAG TPA: nucleoside-diphosphate kinase, partial [Opitutales bacterium]|nr:nucleoside-diphosphate kinase [Opitutales bacterium]
KPDCMESQLCGVVMDRFFKAGFDLKACKMMQLDDAILKVHYAHLADKPFFPEIADFMKSKPVLVLILEGNNAIERVRDLLGPTDSAVAPKGTIRGDYGTGKMTNIAHASDSLENAQAEIARFFRPDEVFA